MQALQNAIHARANLVRMPFNSSLQTRHSKLLAERKFAVNLGLALHKKVLSPQLPVMEVASCTTALCDRSSRVR